MKLYLMHCGFYDEEIGEGVYEFHVNIPVAAQNLEEAKRQVRKDPAFQARKMHVDGIQEIQNIAGYRLTLVPDQNQTTITNHLYRDL